MEGNVEGNIEQFVLQPANKKMHYKCRITRDRKGMDRGLYPTYFLHLERDYGKRVCFHLFILAISLYIYIYFYIFLYIYCIFVIFIDFPIGRSKTEKEYNEQLSDFD